MTIIPIPQANPATPTNELRNHGVPTTTPIRTLRHRVARRVRSARREREHVVTLSEQALAGIHNVHSLHR